MGCSNLTLMLNRACSGSCDICSTKSYPGAKEKLNYELIKRFLSDSQLQKELKTITFTGGEPFVFYEDLKKYIALAGQMGIRTICYTNGFFADTDIPARNKLSELKELGLNEIAVSFDYYHQKHVNIENIKNLLQAAEKEELPYTLYMTKTRQQKLGYILNQLEEYFINGHFMVTPCLPVGNACDCLEEEEYVRNLTPNSQTCQLTGNLLIKYDGSILCCNSPGMLENGFIFGNYADNTYAQVKQKLKDDPLISIIRNQSFDKILTIARDELLIPLPETIVSPCELCLKLLSGENLKKVRNYFNQITFEVKKENIVNKISQRKEYHKGRGA